jgi:hypothetical protein
VPKVLGGKKTVALCGACHPKAHGKAGHWNTSQLTKEALQILKNQGKFTGGSIPFGWQVVEGWLVPHPEELAVRQIIVLWRRGGVTLQAICDTLNQMEIPPKRGKHGWKEGTIRKICQRDDPAPIR